MDGQPENIKPHDFEMFKPTFDSLKSSRTLWFISSKWTLKMSLLLRLSSVLTVTWRAEREVQDQREHLTSVHFWILYIWVQMYLFVAGKFEAKCQAVTGNVQGSEGGVSTHGCEETRHSPH